MPLLLAVVRRKLGAQQFWPSIEVGRREQPPVRRGSSRQQLPAVRAELHAEHVRGLPEPAVVGSGGTVLTGMSPDASKSVTFFSFAEGNTATTVEFDGAPKDPVLSDLVLELGQKQDTEIKNWQAA
jgi:hypothetical protein